MREKAKTLLKALAEAHGVPGREDAVRRLFCRELEGFPLRTDRLGNVICELAGDGPRVMVTGHMDEVGLLVRAITAEGFLRISPIGGWWTHTLMAQRVRILTRDGHEVPGVVSSTPPHLLSKEKRDQVVPMEELCVDVGASDREEVAAYGVEVGDAIAPDSSLVPLANPDRLMCKAFDNRVGIAVTIQSLQALATRDHPNTVVGLGTVQEEVGARGARAAGSGAAPDVALVMEGTPADDGPGFNRVECQAEVGRGVQIRVSDATAIMNRALIDFVLAVASDTGIPHQVAVRRSGGTDAAGFQVVDGGVPVVVLGVPARYIHTHNAIIDLDDYLSALHLVLELVPRLDRDTVAGFTDFLAG